MVTPKNLIQNSKADLGWDTRDADYTSWHNAVKEYCARHSIRTWGAASQAEKDALVITARGLTEFRPTIRDRLASGSDFHNKALEALLQDCLKKCSETAKNLAIKRTRKRAHTDVVSDGDDEVPDGENKPIAVLFWDMVKAYVPAGRKVREIIGALEDPTPPNLTFPADYISLHSDAEVRGFFRMTKANPVRLLVILHTLPPRANTPPPGAAYFELEKFAPPTEYNDYAKDSTAIVRNATGVGRRHMPIRDHTFEERKYELRVRIKRQQDTQIAVKAEHQHLFPNVGIIDSDNEGYCYIDWLKKPKPTTGPQLVKARQECQRFRGQELGALTDPAGANGGITSPPFQEEDEGEEDEDTVLQPPHLALSSKRRAASDGIRPARKIRIEYGALIPSSRQPSSPTPVSTIRAPIPSSRQPSSPTPVSTIRAPIPSSRQPPDELDLIVQKLSRVVPRSRSFCTLPEQYRELTNRAVSHVYYYTLFGNPMMNAEDFEYLLSISWHKAQEETERALPCTKMANTHNHQRHFRASEITEVIFRKYFASVKMWRNFNPSFFDSINEVFICLVAYAMCHCLKTWSTGVYVKPAKNADFKYATTVSTWNAYPSNVRKLLLAAIKADLCARLADSQKSGLLESKEPLQINDASAFEAELKKELFQAQ
ncbi:hypothetical protein L211DRAFT_849818 [Terfezia boudieri ATCC MYA-4762]|uniref:DUF6532 domain-containing protein n=1 Tax=Terfezia boudieri ATCC MYA-4762 TaxID=1051890 RepID=A0A3N4LL63_9PEZI|nr:hypothetical protein L211DRAFT_849818 [Terfezia boudieri ATCC MYA-4762]